jgi:hypothetical protein
MKTGAALIIRKIALSALVLCVTSLNIACSKSGDGGANESSSSLAQVISDYHQTYASITGTNVEIKSIILRLADGSDITLPNSAQTVNLQDLKALGKGIKISTAGLQLPGDAQTFDVVEVVLNLTEGAGQLTFQNGQTCAMKTSKIDMLYTTAPINLTVGNTYLVKVEFTAIDDVQLFCKNRGGAYRHHSEKEWSEKTSGGQECSKKDDSQKTCELGCSLANRRAQILNIINIADEF